jgi:hypothetical protein
VLRSATPPHDPISGPPLPLRDRADARPARTPLGGWLAQSLTGLAEHNADRLDRRLDALSWPEYLRSAHFWEATLQNWQSEFLAVASLAILSVYLRQRGSPQSKPVGAPHRTRVSRTGARSRVCLPGKGDPLPAEQRERLRRHRWLRSFYS